MTYYICPICKGLMMPSVWGHAYKWCGYCHETRDIDDCETRED